MKSKRKFEVSLESLGDAEFEKLSYTPNYFGTVIESNSLGVLIEVRDSDIVEALESLPVDKREIILLYYFLEMTDQEIATQLHMLRQTVQYRRNISLELLKKIIEELENE